MEYIENNRRERRKRVASRNDKRKLDAAITVLKGVSHILQKFESMEFDLKQLSTQEKQYYLQHLVAPRPICFASTIDKEGKVNLSPFSFFNLFSTNPPIVIFSPSRRVRDNTTKHSLQNVLEVPEVVINIVDYNMVQQTSLASCEYPKGVDEFKKAGFTKEKAKMVQPPMVAESKAKLECKVIEIKELGNGGRLW